jgi:tetraacyldisaccharide 4'-kinase
MPSGRLREWRSAYKRANAIIVTKCPALLTQEKKSAIIKKINPLPSQKIFFSKYIYHDIYHFYEPRYRMNLSSDHRVLLISAIANTNYLKTYLQSQNIEYLSQEYTDHHNFIQEDIDQLINNFKNLSAEKKYILTTEKDAVRLLPFRNFLYENAIPIYVLPIEVVFIDEDKDLFDKYIKDKLMEFEI